MPIRVLSLDFDGCLATPRYCLTEEGDVARDIVKCNRAFLDQIKDDIKGSPAIVMVGSNRQSHLADLENATVPRALKETKENIRAYCMAIDEEKKYRGALAEATRDAEEKLAALEAARLDLPPGATRDAVNVDYKGDGHELVGDREKISAAISAALVARKAIAAKKSAEEALKAAESAVMTMTESSAFLHFKRSYPDLIKEKTEISYKPGHYFPEIIRIAEDLGARLDRFLMADIDGGQEAGTAFDKSINQGADHGDWSHDKTKASILYAQMHRIASQHPGEEIIFDFYDDRADILDSLRTFFTEYPLFIPTNVTLRLHQYTSYDMDVSKPFTSPIKGTGRIDINYQKTIKLINSIITDILDATLASIKNDDDRYYSETRLRGAHPVAKHMTPEILAFEQWKENISQLLTTLNEKAIALKANGHKTASRTAEDLSITIKAKIKEHLTIGRKPINIRSFMEECTTAINEARPTLGHHRGWKKLLGNLGIAILSLGVGYLVAGLFQKALTGNFLLFRPKTDAEKKLATLEREITQQLGNSLANAVKTAITDMASEMKTEAEEIMAELSPPAPAPITAPVPPPPAAADLTPAEDLTPAPIPAFRG